MANELVKVVRGIPVHARPQDRYVNATALCKAGGKSFHEFERNRETQEFLDALAANRRILRFDLIQKRRGGGGGTWVHPEVAIRLCIWISPEFATQVTEWINTLLTEGRVELTPVAAPLPSLPPAAAVQSVEIATDPLIAQMIAGQQMYATLIETRRQQLALERQQEQLRADAADTRALAVCAANTARAALDQANGNHGYYAVLGYARLRRWDMTLSEASAHGRQLTALCRTRGIEVRRVSDPRFGEVNIYPQTLLDEYFGERAAG